MSCTRRWVKTEQLVALHIFISLVVSSTRSLEHFVITHACVKKKCSSLHKSLCICDVWSGLRHCASKNTSSSMMSHPNFLGLHPQSFTSFSSTPLQPPQTTCSTKPERASTLTNNQDHIAGKGCTSMTHFNLVHKFIPMPQRMKIPDAKAALDKEWKKLDAILAWQLEKVKSKKEVTLEAQRDKKKVHFATLMDICHPNKCGVRTLKVQKYKGRVVLRGDIVKDDSGSYAVFAERGSSASQMTAAKVMDVIARQPDSRRTSSRRGIRLHSGKKWRMLQDCSEFQSQSVQIL